MRRRRPRTRRARRRLVFGSAVVATVVIGIIVVAAGSARDLITARSQLEQARSSLNVLGGDSARFADEGERARAVREIARARAQLFDADALIRTSPFLDIVSVAPGVAFQRDGLGRLIDDVDDAAASIDRLLGAVGALQAPGEPGEATVPLRRVATFESEVRGVAGEMLRVTRGRRGLWEPLAKGRRALDEETGPAAARLTTAADTIAAFRTFFGEGGTRRYFVAGQNNAEMRAQGMFLSFAVLRFDDGDLTVERTDPIEAIELNRPAFVALPEGTNTVFGGLLPTQQWRSVNAMADFPTTARTAMAMYEAATRQRVDGVIGLDVPALADLLSVTGPVDVPGFGQMTEENAAPFLLAGQYEGLATGAPQRRRRDRVSDVADLVARRLADGDLDRVALGRRLAKAAAGRHVMLWSANERESNVFADARLTGSLVTPPDQQAIPTFHVAVQDATGSKVDYFIRPRLDVDVRVTPGGTAIVRTKVSVENQAPTGALPSYALGPNNASTSKPGQYVSRIYQWEPLTSSSPGSVEESGLRVVQQPILIEPGSTGTVEFETIVPDAVVDGHLRLRFVPQPRQVPVPLKVRVTTPSGRLQPFSVDLSESRAATWRIPGG